MKPRTRLAIGPRRRRRAEKAIARMRSWRGSKACPHGLPWNACAHAVGDAYGREFAGWDAIDGWRGVPKRHRHRDIDAPRGALVFWSGARWGHVAVANGRGRCWTIGLLRPGTIGLVPIRDVAALWGNLTYLGWVYPDRAW